MTEKDDSEKASESDGGKKDVAEKLKTMGLMPSDDKETMKTETQDVNKGRHFPLMMAVIFAGVIAGIVFFFSGKDMNMDISDLGSDLGISDLINSVTEDSGSSADDTEVIAAEANKPVATTGWPTDRSSTMANRKDSWTPPEMPDWVQDQRSKMDERIAQRRQDRKTQNWTPAEPPAWVKEQQAKRKQQRPERPDWAKSQGMGTPPEMPAWVKERQAMMEKQRSQRPDWAGRGSDMPRPERPAWITERQSRMMAQRPEWAQPRQRQQAPATNVAPRQQQVPAGPVYYPPVAPGYGYYGPAPYYYGPWY